MALKMRRNKSPAPPSALHAHIKKSRCAKVSCVNGSVWVAGIVLKRRAQRLLKDAVVEPASSDDSVSCNA